MQKRRSHNKSRKGCQNCKRRHVKCDEQGPPCANCVVRETQDTCSFGSNHSSPAASSPISGFSNLSLASDPRKRLDLELMHRWSTSTFLSMCSMEHDRPWLQNDVPRWALRHEFLLHGILAFAALDIAISGTSATDSQPIVYVRAALEYYDQASQRFRTELRNITAENVESVFIFSSLAVAINMAVMQWEYLAGNAKPNNMLARLAALAELLRGSSSIAVDYFDILMKGTTGTSIQLVLDSIEKVPDDPLPDQLLFAIRRMRVVVAKCVIIPDDDDVESPDSVTSLKKAFKTAVEALALAFVEDFKDDVRGVCKSFPSLAGPVFGIALRASDPVAMFIMMHWGVLLDRLGRLAWWVKFIGKWMVSEISERLLEVEVTSKLPDIPEWRMNIEWAREIVDMSDEERLKW